MTKLQYIIIFSLIGGAFSLIGGALLLRNKQNAGFIARYATPFAGGALLAAVFLDLLKEGVKLGNTDGVLLAVLIGIVTFFLAEGFLHWFHHHHEHGEEKDPRRWLIIIGDIIHNALDGVAIAASFLISIPTGIVTTLAVAAHEIPQEIGDFGLLLSKGMRRRDVLLVNVTSAFATTVAAIVTYWLGSQDKLPLGVLLGLSAGFLLYIATSDVIPTIHAKSEKQKFFNIQAALFVAGVLLVGFVTTVAHQYIETGHSRSAIEQCSPTIGQIYDELETYKVEEAYNRTANKEFGLARGISVNQAICYDDLH